MVSRRGSSSYFLWKNKEKLKKKEVALRANNFIRVHLRYRELEIRFYIYIYMAGKANVQQNDKQQKKKGSSGKQRTEQLIRSKAERSASLSPSKSKANNKRKGSIGDKGETTMIAIKPLLPLFPYMMPAITGATHLSPARKRLRGSPRKTSQDASASSSTTSSNPSPTKKPSKKKAAAKKETKATVKEKRKSRGRPRTRRYEPIKPQPKLLRIAPAPYAPLAPHQFFKILPATAVEEDGSE